MSTSYSVLAFSGSLRAASTNTGLLRYAQSHAPASMRIELTTLADIPLFNADMEAQGCPAGVARLVKQVSRAQALLLGCPEYNYSMAPALKNALDWLSRVPDNAALAGKPVAILGSGGGMGTSRAQYHLRQTCVYLDLHPLNKPEVFINAFSGVFDAQGTLVGAEAQAQITAMLESFERWIARCC